MHKHTIGRVGFFVIGLACTLSAQSPVDPAANSIGVMYQLDAVQVDTPPVMDGLVLEDSAWGTATPATGFVQSMPNEGESASEKTEVRVIFTADSVYFGVVCYDKDPLSGSARILSVYIEGEKVFQDDPATGKLSGEAVR